MQTQQRAFTLFDLWHICRAHLMLVVSVTALFFAAFVAYALLSSPVYRSEVVMLPSEGIGNTGIDAQLGAFSSLGILAGLSPGDAGTIEAIATLESNAFLERFIVRHSLLPVLYRDLWDESGGTWRSEIAEEDIPTIAKAIKLFKKCCLSITEDSATQLTTLAIEWRDPAYAASWANQIIQDLNFEMQAREIEEADSMISYLRAELDKTNVVGLEQAIFRLLEQQVQRKTFARVREDYALRIIDPAVAAEEDDFVRPNRLMLAATGLLGGVLTGVIFALMLNHLRILRSNESAA